MGLTGKIIPLKYFNIDNLFCAPGQRMVLIGGYDDSLKRLGVQSWQQGASGCAPSYHFDMLQV